MMEPPKDLKLMALKEGSPLHYPSAKLTSSRVRQNQSTMAWSFPGNKLGQQSEAPVGCYWKVVGLQHKRVTR